MEKPINTLSTVLLTGVRRILWVLFLVYLILFAVQRHLLFPTHIANAHGLGRPSDYNLTDFTEVPLTTSDGVKIEGWNHAPKGDMPIILYFHGNGENIAARAERYRDFTREGYGIFALEYRGYGNNEGSPSEEGLYKDARTAMQWLSHQYLTT